MPRNDQATRQMHTLRRLEAPSNGLTLDQLLGGPPPDYPKHPRTLRRDLYALEAAGFLLLNERLAGRGEFMTVCGG
jgi:hypothetical protein